MKLPQLLSTFLREQKLLSLPGIGVFHLSGTLPPDSESPEVLSSYISFENKKVREPDEALIDFIRKQTGKIRPLAMADLDSYLASGLQLLNIGKPFYIEGIGSVLRIRDGEYEFSVGEITSTRIDLGGNQEEKRKSVFEESKFEPASNPLRKVMILLLILAGIIIVIGGGYLLYIRTNQSVKQKEEQTLKDSSGLKQPIVDTAISRQDSSIMVSHADGAYKFVVLNTTSKRRALSRYNQLRFSTPLKMETTDSSNFKLYFVIQAVASDTAKIRDSLSRYYANKVVVEQ